MLRTRIHPQSKKARAALSSPLKRCYHFLCVCVCARTARIHVVRVHQQRPVADATEKFADSDPIHQGACEIVSRPRMSRRRHRGAEKRWEIHFHVLGGNFKCVRVCLCHSHVRGDHRSREAKNARHLLLLHKCPPGRALQFNTIIIARARACEHRH